MSDPVEASRSMLNPQDVAVKMQRGEIPAGGQGMTIGQLLEQLGISPDDPVQVALQKIKQHASNATPMGKAQSIAQKAGGSPAGPPSGGAPPMGGMPPGGGQPPPQGQGLAGLMGR